MRHTKAREAGQLKVMAMGGLQCPFCFKYFISLGNHVTASHRMTAKQFRMNQGYRHDRSLVAEFKRQEYVERGLENSRKLPDDHMKKMHEKNHHPKYKLSKEGHADKVKNRNPKFCSLECRECGKQFKTKFNLREKAKYCSTSCSNKDYERHKRKVTVDNKLKTPNPS